MRIVRIAACDGAAWRLCAVRCGWRGGAADRRLPRVVSHVVDTGGDCLHSFRIAIACIGMQSMHACGSLRTARKKLVCTVLAFAENASARCRLPPPLALRVARHSIAAIFPNKRLHTCNVVNVNVSDENLCMPVQICSRSHLIVKWRMCLPKAIVIGSAAEPSPLVSSGRVERCVPHARALRVVAATLVAH